MKKELRSEGTRSGDCGGGHVGRPGQPASGQGVPSLLKLPAAPPDRRQAWGPCHHKHTQTVLPERGNQRPRATGSTALSILQTRGRRLSKAK